MGPTVGIALAVVLAVLWALVTILRRNRLQHVAAGGAGTREALTEFADRSLELQSVDEILSFAREAADAVFACDRVVAFQAGAEDGTWEAAVPGEGPLAEPPAAVRGLFAWFKHNPDIAVQAELAEGRFGAMRPALQQVMGQYDVDLLMPLVDRKQLLAVVGLRLGRPPTVVDRESIRLFRLQATAACANVRLHREAAHMVSLAQEVGLASAVQLALVPDALDGEHDGLTWHGAFQVAGEAGSDFWGVYPMGEAGVMMIIGDAVGAGLGGSMVSAVVKSCADAIFDGKPSILDPGRLLAALNRALYRSTSPVHASCFAVHFDAAGGEVRYANAGHDIPYHRREEGGQVKLGVLSGSGPLLGDDAEASYAVKTAPMGAGDVFVLFTDGLIKVRGPHDKPFGERKLQKLLQAGPGADPAALRTSITDAVKAYRAGTPIRDDAALVVVKA